MNKSLLLPEVQQFIKDHENHDPFSLSLKHQQINGVDIKEVAAQIGSRKKAKNKLPTWYATDNIIFPPPLSMEQCSSELTAKFKASLISGHQLVDLTGGSGVDTYFLAQSFKSVDYIERFDKLCQITKHNFTQLNANNITSYNTEAEQYLNDLQKEVDAIYIDPARRGDHNEKVFKFEDCEPNIVTLAPKILSISPILMIKASPMMDIALALKSLKNVKAIHVVAVNNECKEVLYILDQNETTNPEVNTVNINSLGTDQYQVKLLNEQASTANLGEITNYLYEPNASVMKAGLFNSLCQSFDVIKLHTNTHLYSSDQFIGDFPGRKFKVNQVVEYDKKKLLKLIPEKKANITCRNFPDDVKKIRAKTKLKDGGDVYLFAFTDVNNQKKIAVTEKVGHENQQQPR